MSWRRATPATRYTPAHRQKPLEVPACGPTTPSPRIACQTQTRDKPVKQIGTPVLCRRTTQTQRSDSVLHQQKARMRKSGMAAEEVRRVTEQGSQNASRMP